MRIMKGITLVRSLGFMVCILALLAITAIPVLAYHSSAAPQDAPPLKVALLAPLTGGAAFVGLPGKNGVEMAVAEWNAKGGVLGRQVELVVEDTQCNGTVAPGKATKVIDEDGVHYIVGAYCSSASIPVSVIAEAKGVVMISPTSTNLNVTITPEGAVKQYVFRACFTDPFQGTMTGKFAVDQGLMKGFVLHDANSGYTTSLAETFKEAYSLAGGEIVGDEIYDPGANDFSALFTSIKDSQAEVVYLPDFMSFANKFVPLARASGITAVFIGGDGWSTSSPYDLAVDGSFYTDQFTLDDPHPAVKAWIQAYQDQYGEDPQSSAALSYDAVNVLLTAIQEAGVDDPAVVKDYLARLQFDAVTGKIAFDPLHNPYKAVVFQQIVNGLPEFFTSYAPFGTITGHVFAASDGAVITGPALSVQAIGVTPGTDSRETFVLQSDGSFTFGGLIPGQYKLLANSTHEAGFVSKYYNNKLNEALADLITVGASDVRQGIDFHLEAQVATQVVPDQEAVLQYHPKQGTSTDVTIPAGAVDAPTTLQYTPASADNSSGFLFAGGAFNLEAYQNGEPLHNFTFAVPIEITLHYVDSPQTQVNEEAMTLRYWDDSTQTWKDALCPGHEYTRDLVNNTLTVPVCHLSSFAIFAPGYGEFLPQLWR